MRIDHKTISTMTSAGIHFFVDIKTLNGAKTVPLHSSHVAAYVEDPVQFAADFFGASKENYIAWLEADGVPRCGAITKAGKRCKKNVSGGSHRSIDDWLELEGDYCTVHGGDTSEEARAKQ